MRVETELSIAYRTRVLVLSDEELETMRAASRVAERARELMRSELGVADAEAHCVDLVLAQIEHNPGEFEDGRIELDRALRPWAVR